LTQGKWRNKPTEQTIQKNEQEVTMPLPRILAQPDSTHTCHRACQLDFQPQRRRFLGTVSSLALAAGCLSLVGCAGKEEPGLRIATNQWIGYELLYLGQELAAKEAPADYQRIRLIELLSNTDSIQALAAGTVDGAGLTLDEAISARAAGLDLKIALVFDFSAGADVLLARPGITRLDQLKGKNIGVEQTGVGALMLDAAKKQAGLARGDVHVISMTADQHLAAFKQGKIDALVTFEPIASQIIAAGGQPLFDSRAIPGGIVDVLAITGKALADNPNTLRTLLTRYFSALNYLQQQPEDASRRMAPRLGLTPAAVQAGYARLVLPDLAENRRLLSGVPAPLEATAAQLATLMLREKLLAREIDVKQFITAESLPELEA
jgi:NitT/TauT family transport system substrate-binding protein